MGQAKKLYNVINNLYKLGLSLAKLSTNWNWNFVGSSWIASN